MAKKIARLIFAIAGAAAGAGIVVAVDRIIVSLGYLSLYDVMYTWGLAIIFAAAGIIFAIIFYIFSPKLIDAAAASIKKLETHLSSMATDDVVYCVLGLITGLVIAFLLSTLTSAVRPGWLGFILDAIMYVLFGYLGWSVMSKRKGNISGLPAVPKGKIKAGMAKPKLLDTSVIIDGRIADICATGIIEGTLIVPAFVLQELQHIADSSDTLKRNRGRRGLDILKALQENGSVPVNIVSNDYEDITEVDSKLIRLAADMRGVVVTNDYNLNKVAAVRNVPVLNINELANAVKPVALPGEEMLIQIVKEGKEPGQGVGYLDDGTMIVVEGGRKLMGETVEVAVTTVLQTAAGRMIFARIK